MGSPGVRLSFRAPVPSAERRAVLLALGYSLVPSLEGDNWLEVHLFGCRVCGPYSTEEAAWMAADTHARA